MSQALIWSFCVFILHVQGRSHQTFIYPSQTSSFLDPIIRVGGVEILAHNLQQYCQTSAQSKPHIIYIPRIPANLSTNRTIENRCV